MFKKLLEKAESAGFKTAVAKGLLVCPNCGAKPRSVPHTPQDVVVCVQCGTKASAREWSAVGSGGERVGNPDRPPANTKITRAVNPDGTVIWNIPASGKSGGLFIFGILWLSITAVVSFGMLFGKSESGNGPPAMFLILFLGVFWAVGLGMLYAGCRNKFAKHQVSVNREAVTLRRELFGRPKDKSLARDGISSVAQVEFYQQNYEPVRGVEIRSGRGKLRFGSVLSEDEKAWLVADLKRIILGESATAASGGHPIAVRQSYFSFPLPKSANNLWPFAMMLCVMGIGFVFVGLYMIEPNTGMPDKQAQGIFNGLNMFFQFMDSGFRSLWILMSGVMAAIGISLAIWLHRTRDQETRIDATESEIAIRTARHGLVLKERVFPRASVVDIRASVSGNSNGKTMKRIELIVGGKAEIVTRWTIGEKADAYVEEFRRAL